MNTRALILWAFALGSLAWAVGTQANQVPAPVPAPVQDPKPAPKVKKTWQVLGFGLDQTAAVENGVKKATELVRDYLRTQEPPFEWKPSLEYVKNHLVKDNPERLAQHDYTVQEKGKDVTWQCWGLTVEITYADFEAMRRDNDQLVRSQKAAERQALRQQKQGERLSLLAKITALLLVGFLLTLGYLRLEDKTKGYCSRLLFFGAVTSWLVFGAGLFLVL
jgi:hypothetical protein